MIKNIFEVNSRGQPTSASVDINRFFAWIIAGPSGSGKSTFLRRLLGLISFYDTDAEAYFLDFKADEEMFPMIGDHVARGFYCLELFEARLSKQEENSHNLYLIFDEWQAFLAYLEQTDKKKHKDVLSKMLMMNSLGRSLGLRIILSSQRFLMSDLPGRYNFNCIISLSTSFLMSTNNRQLLFPDMEKDEVVIKPRGYGCFVLFK